MHMINLTPCEPGVYCDHYKSGGIVPPDGWAYIPDDFPLPSTFPRLGSIEVEEVTYYRDVETEQGDTEQQPYTMLTVTAMTEGEVPPVSESVPTWSEQMEAQLTYTAMMTDTLLEV